MKPLAGAFSFRSCGVDGHSIISINVPDGIERSEREVMAHLKNRSLRYGSYEGSWYSSHDLFSLDCQRGKQCGWNSLKWRITVGDTPCEAKRERYPLQRAEKIVSILE